MAQLAHAVLLVGAGLAVGLLGRWGRANAVALAPAHLGTDDRERRVRQLHRGAAACYAAALVLVVAGVLAVL